MRARSSWRLLAARPSPHPLIPRGLHRSTPRMNASTTSTTTDAERVAAETAQRAASDGALRGADLLSRLRAVYETSGACGARIHSQTSVHVQREGGVEFVLRVLPSLKAKPQGPAGAAAAKGEAAKPPPPPQTNPFLPYDPRLFVANLSPTHCLLLNKFDVVPLHSLVVTRDFEAQTEPLNARDLAATWRAMAALAAAEASASSGDGSAAAAAAAAAAAGGDDTGALAFYNCGEHSGRSQPHKHVQVVPLPFLGEGGEGGGAPIAAIVRRALEEEQEEEKQGFPAIAELRAFPFRAYAARAPPLSTRGQEEEEEESEAFAALERTLGAMVARCAADCGSDASAPSYNLLLTGGWVVAVPRRSERDRPEPQQGADEGGSNGSSGVSVAVNALGFAGTLLCKSEGELGHVRRKGAMRVLADAGWPW